MGKRPNLLCIVYICMYEVSVKSTDGFRLVIFGRVYRYSDLRTLLCSTRSGMTTSLPEKPHGGTGWRNRHQNSPHPLAAGGDVGVKDLLILCILLVTDTPPRSWIR